MTHTSKKINNKKRLIVKSKYSSIRAQSKIPTSKCVNSEYFAGLFDYFMSYLFIDYVINVFKENMGLLKVGHN